MFYLDVLFVAVDLLNSAIPAWAAIKGSALEGDNIDMFNVSGHADDLRRGFGALRDEAGALRSERGRSRTQCNGFPSGAFG